MARMGLRDIRGYALDSLTGIAAKVERDVVRYALDA
jgi:hypothetical protein